MENVKIHDDFVDNELNEKLQDLLANTEWKYGYKSVKSIWKETHPHWSKYFYMSDIKSDDQNLDIGTPIASVTFQDECIQLLYNKIKEKLPSNARLIRCYANGHTCGVDANIHYDDIRENTITFIFYPMSEWNVDWGGETIFWNRQTREIVKSVFPKSNRLLEFPSYLWHGARPISRYCNKLRITLMFKFIII
jgi:SM-20-related protein